MCVLLSFKKVKWVVDPLACLPLCHLSEPGPLHGGNGAVPFWLSVVTMGDPKIMSLSMWGLLKECFIFNWVWFPSLWNQFLVYLAMHTGVYLAYYKGVFLAIHSFSSPNWLP